MAASDKLTEGLRLAVEAVADAKVPDDLRQIAFERALDHTLGSAQPPAQQPGAPASPAGAGGGQASKPPSDSPLGVIAAKLGVDEELIADTFNVEGDTLELLTPHDRFDKTMANATVQIGALVVAARQALGLDEWTASEAVREACRDRGHLSSSNFAKYVKPLPDKGFRVRGKGASREYQVNAKGYAYAAEVVKTVNGVAS